ncbi:DUF424 family protein [Candidatus Pacearchaeota archaeon]|nr:DUF424 family protein [Candidatus Pacearchaeota archaeon]
MSKDILVKVHKSYRWVVAVCDEELLGRKLIEGKRALDISGNFFKGEAMNYQDAKEEISRCNDEDATFNFVGNRSVEVAKELGIVNDESIIEIEGIPFALALL